jgi:hypothetical protein
MRWVKSRKVAVINEHLSGLSEEVIYLKYGITGPELREWVRKYKTFGEYSLRITKETLYRRLHAETAKS